MKTLLLFGSLVLNQYTLSFSGPNWTKINDWKFQEKSQMQQKIIPTSLNVVPKQEHIQNTIISFKNDLEKNLWIALALHKIGFMSVMRHQDFTNAVIAFQKYTQAKRQDGVICNDTIGRLNSIIIQQEQLNPNLKKIEPPALPMKQNNENQNHFYD